jgi:hypothetical protein
VIVPPAWDGSNCAGPCCPERTEDPRHFGVYRWLISNCSASVHWESPLFTMPSKRNALYRIRAAMHLSGVSVAQLDALSAEESIAASPDRIAGYSLAGPELPLSAPLVSELAHWLGGPGFKDDVLRRCKRGKAFGFRGVRRAPGHDLAEDTELALDLNCNSIALVYQEGAVRRRMDSFFDPSRPVMLHLLEQVVPAAFASDHPH